MSGLRPCATERDFDNLESARRSGRRPGGLDDRHRRHVASAGCEGGGTAWGVRQDTAGRATHCGPRLQSPSRGTVDPPGRGAPRGIIRRTLRWRVGRIDQQTWWTADRLLAFRADRGCGPGSAPYPAADNPRQPRPAVPPVRLTRRSGKPAGRGIVRPRLAWRRSRPLRSSAPVPG